MRHAFATLSVRRILLVGLALLAAAPVVAEPDDSDWTVYQAPPAPGPVAPPTTAEGGFSAPERDKLNDWAHSGLLDRVCKKAALNKGFDFGRDGVGTGVDVRRSLEAFPDGRMALVEEQQLRASFSFPFSKPVGGEGAATGLSVGGNISGASWVVRPLASKEPCDEIFTVADLRQVKTVVPFTAERLAAMRLGELWRVPLTLVYTQSASASDPLHGGGGVSVSFGRSDGAAASMTVYRLAEDKLRFRFRMDRVVVHSKSSGVSMTVPPLEFAQHAGNILVRFVEGQVAHELAKRTSVWLNASTASSDGKKAILEFVVDPRDPEQAEALAKIMRGDVREIGASARRITLLQVTDDSTREKYERLAREHAEALGKAGYAALDEYQARARSWSFNVPFLVQHGASDVLGSDRAVPFGDGRTEFRYYRAAQGSSNQYFDMPFIGSMVRENLNRSAEAVTAGLPGQAHGEPILVYTRTQDFTRVPATSVRGDIAEVNDVLALAGAQRGSSRRLTVSADAVVPPVPPQAQAKEDRAEWSDRKGYLSFTLVFNQQAVRDLASASGEALLRAAAAATSDPWSRPLADWLAKNARVENGVVTYDQEAARRDFPQNVGEGNPDYQGDLAALSRQAAGLIADVAAVREAPSNEARAEALARLAGGKGRSGLGYEQALKILVQFVDPLDLTGDFAATVQSTAKGVENRSTHFVLKKDRAEVPMLGEAGATKARFAESTLLTD